MMVFSAFPEGVLLNVNKVARFEIYPAMDSFVIEASFDNDHSVVLYQGEKHEMIHQLDKLAYNDFPVIQLGRWLKYGTQVFNLEKVLYFEVVCKDLAEVSYPQHKYGLIVCNTNFETLTLATGTRQAMMKELYDLYVGD